MGVDYTVYVGPFVKCKNSETKVNRKIRSCTNPGCRNYENQYWDKDKKFCELCGAKIGDVIIKTKGKKVNTDPAVVNEDLYCNFIDADGAREYTKSV